tara:strand:- start:211 stop:639 length:429 start_codon:yes stop_codon:yes gene_type:complete
MIEYQRNTNERRNMRTANEVIAKLNDAKNGIYSAAELGSIWVPNEMLPESYHDEREGGRSLDRLQQEAQQEPAEVDAREKSVVISHGKIMSGNQERVNILNQYQNDADTESEIDYSINEYRLYRNEQAFAKAIGLDLEEEEV